MSVVRNVAANYIGRAYSIGSIYLFTPFYIKHLGLAAYGVIGFYGIILAIGALVDVGLTATLSREAARRQDRRDLLDLTATIERILLAASMAFALIVCLAAGFIARRWLNSTAGITEGDLIAAIRLMALTIPAQLGVSLYVGGILGLQKQGLGNAIQALYVTVRGGLVIPFLALSPSLEVFFAWQLAASVAMMIVARVALMRSMGMAPFALGQASFRVLRPALHFASGMFALTLLSGLNTQLDKAVVSKVFTIEQFGTYSLASTLSLLPYAAVAPLMMAMLPRLTEMVSRGLEEEASDLYGRFVQLVALIAGFGCFGLAMFAPEVLKIWLQLDSPPPDAVELVRILALGSLFLALAATPFYLGLAHGHSRTSVVTGFVTAALLVPLLLAATRWLGLAGAAIPWVIINCASFAALSWNIHRKFYHGRSHPLAATLVLVALTAAVIYVARALSWWLDLSPLAACATAGATAGVAAAVLLYARHYNTLPMRTRVR